MGIQARFCEGNCKSGHLSESINRASTLLCLGTKIIINFSFTWPVFTLILVLIAFCLICLVISLKENIHVIYPPISILFGETLSPT